MRLYDNFDLYLFEHNGEYSVQVSSPQSGQGTEPVVLSFTDAQMEALIAQAEDNVTAPQQVGQALYNAVFHGAVAERLASSLTAAELANRGMRIRLHLDDTPRLARLPWEYLYRQDSNFFGLSARTPIVRYLHIDKPEARPRITQAFNILAVLSNPTDQPELDVEAEWQQLQQEFSPLDRLGLARIERLRLIPGEDMWSSLQSRLRQGDLHAIHFVGHGAFLNDDEGGVLCFEDEQRGSALVTAAQFATLLNDHQIKLVYLNACQSGLGSTTNPMTGVAHQLVRINVPAVVAMTMKISDNQARRIAREFYRALVQDRYPVDAALAEGRKAIFRGDPDQEWGKSVLFMRSPDGQIFDIAQKPRNRQRMVMRPTYEADLTLSEAALCQRLTVLVQEARLPQDEFQRLTQASLPTGFAQPVDYANLATAIEQIWDIRDADARGITVIEFAERLGRYEAAAATKRQIYNWMDDALSHPDLNMNAEARQQIVDRLTAPAADAATPNEPCYLMVRVMTHPSTKTEYQVDAWTQLPDGRQIYQTGHEGDRHNRHSRSYKADELPTRLFAILEQIAGEGLKPDVVEVFLPLDLLGQAVDQWEKDPDDVFGGLLTDTRERLCHRHHVVLRSYERAFEFREADKLIWLERWTHLQEKGLLLDGDRLFFDDDDLYHHEEPATNAARNLYNELMRNQPTKRCAGFKYAPVSKQSNPEHKKALAVSLKAGLPVLLWPGHCYCEQKSAPDRAQDMTMLEALIKATSGNDLPKVVSDTLRNCPTVWDQAGHIGNHLTLLFDDPTRVPTPPQYTGNNL